MKAAIGLCGILGTMGASYAFSGARLMVLQDETRKTLHCPQSMAAHEDALSPVELAELHRRVAGATPQAFGRPMPVADVFDRPAGGLVVVLDGMVQGPDMWAFETPFLGGRHKVDYSARVEGLTGMAGVAKRYAETIDEGRVVCVTGELHKGHCVERAQVVNPLAIVLDLEQLEAFHDDVRQYDHSQEADRAFLGELHTLLALPSTVPEGEASPSHGAADSYLFFSDSVKKLERTYGSKSRQLRSARKLMDMALQRTVAELQKAYNGAFVSQVLLPEQEHLHTRRRLQVASDSGNITSEDLYKVNIITWTAVGLVFVLFMTIGLVMSADSGPKDSLLYAKFQADVGGNKMD